MSLFNLAFFYKVYNLLLTDDDTDEVASGKYLTRIFTSPKDLSLCDLSLGTLLEPLVRFCPGGPESRAGKTRC